MAGELDAELGKAIEACSSAAVRSAHVAGIAEAIGTDILATTLDRLLELQRFARTSPTMVSLAAIEKVTGRLREIDRLLGSAFDSMKVLADETRITGRQLPRPN